MRSIRGWCGWRRTSTDDWSASCIRAEKMWLYDEEFRCATRGSTELLDVMSQDMAAGFTRKLDNDLQMIGVHYTR